MSVERVVRANGTTRYRVRWREAGRNRAETFDRRKDALNFEAEIRRRRQLGTLDSLDAGTETLDEYVTDTWAPAHAPALADSTRKIYALIYDRHLSPYLGDVSLRDITPERIARWQSERLAAGVGPHSVRKAIAILSGVMQRATEARRIPYNPVRVARKARLPKSEPVRPLSPAVVEAIRAELAQRDATLVSILAYAGLRPGEALDLTWGSVQERTLIVDASKTGRRRTVRLLEPLAEDLAAWRKASGDPSSSAFVFPSATGRRWTQEAYKSWTRRTFAEAAAAAGADHATPYSLRHSFVSLLLAEGRSVLYVAAQAGHRPSMSWDTYGHVFEDLDDRIRIDPAEAIRTAREQIGTRLVPAEEPQTTDG
ncbi:site-specific integrase [Baekduia soli]|uniref:Site-specific integrase n=1 Tax=Baekduia soli TaxID=496014 RepID=A0A5B8TZN8_9ACTN|nr:site-specific integrase [Baekduia soli]QEC46175.1 site-specific integrase [Baekduia soli]